MSDSADKNPGFDRSLAQRKGALSDSAAGVKRLAPALGSLRGRRVSVVLKLTLLVGLTLAVLMAAFLTAGEWYWRKVLHTQVDAHLNAVAASRRDSVQAEVALLRQRVALNTDRGEIRGYFYELANHQPPSGNRDGSQVTLNRIADGRPVVAACLVNSEGKVVLSTEPDEAGRDLSAELEFKAGLAGPHVGEPHRANGRFEAILTAPVYSRVEPRRTYGVLRLVADVSDLAGVLRDITGLGETGEAILGVRHGNEIQFLFPPRNAPQKTGTPIAGAPALNAAAEGAAIFSRNRDYRGVPVLAAGRPIGYGGWGLVVKMDEREAYAPIANAQRFGMLVGLVVAAAGLAAAYALALSFTRPVRRLAQAASRVTGGDYDAVVPVQSRDEFGTLSATFNEMTAAIHARRRERDKAEEALREGDRRKDEFLAMLGHELRNPLAAIAHAVLLERDAERDPAIVELARSVIVRQTANLTRLVDDLLDVARITRGKITLRRSLVDIGEVVRRVMDAVRPLIAEHGHQLDLVLSGKGKWRIDGDATRLEQVLTNLLINAARYTPDGGRITLVERQEGAEIVITVSDNGVGIAPELLPQIFELFTQSAQPLARTSGGLGIGLHLCKQLTELHGGTISAHSNGVGKGAAFTVRLPAVAAPEPAGEKTRLVPFPAHHRRRRILLVDDNEDTVHSLSRLLARRGHEVATAFDGMAALRVAHEFQPDVFLLDLGLPGLDGYELARRLRADGFPHARIIAISGYAQESDRARSRAAGFDYHFAKPVDFEALAELVIEEPIAID